MRLWPGREGKEEHAVFLSYRDETSKKARNFLSEGLVWHENCGSSDKKQPVLESCPIKKMQEILRIEPVNLTLAHILQCSVL
jgi:hypothetical protein